MNQTVRGCGGSPRRHILATGRAEYDRCVRMGDDAVRAVTFAVFWPTICWPQKGAPPV